MVMNALTMLERAMQREQGGGVWVIRSQPTVTRPRANSIGNDPPGDPKPCRSWSEDPAALLAALARQPVPFLNTLREP